MNFALLVSNLPAMHHARFVLTAYATHRHSSRWSRRLRRYMRKLHRR